MVFPREHGAWGLLLVPMAIGIAAGALARGRGWGVSTAYLICALAIFLLRTPARTLMGFSLIRAEAGERMRLVLASAAYAAIAIAMGAILIAHLPLMPLLALAAVGAFSVAAEEILMLGGRPWHLWAHSAGAVGLSSTAAGGYLALTGRLDIAALVLWAFSFVFALNQLHFVHLRLRAARARNVAEKLALGEEFIGVMVACAVPMIVALWREWASPLMLLAFLPAGVARARWFLSEPAPLRIHRLGMTELAHNLVFAALLVAALAARAV